MHNHGFLDGPDGQETIVHPGDYIITNRKGLYYAVRPEDFEAMYEPYDPTPHPETPA